MSDCIFCQIVSGQIPSSKVYEDEEVLAFLDITQVTKGHTLVIPKNITAICWKWMPSLPAASLPVSQKSPNSSKKN